MKADVIALLTLLITHHQAFAWGAVEGRYGGAAYRGPYSEEINTPSAQQRSEDLRATLRCAARRHTAMAASTDNDLSSRRGCSRGRSGSGRRCSSYSRNSSLLSAALLHAVYPDQG